MRKHRAAIFLLFLTCLAASPFLRAKDKGDIGRLLTGKVLNRADQPASDAVVYLTDTHTKSIKTYIIGPDGLFHFPGLSLNVDYELYALYKGHKSDTKTVSQFDNRQQVNINLRVDAN
jgi:5-formaminoimidazole-4-carboxamide-1-beta-D-ribofuranosyl 5'-monophosphate synthetase